MQVHASLHTASTTQLSPSGEHMAMASDGIKYTSMYHTDNQRVAKWAILPCKTGHFIVRNGPFYRAKWAVSQRKMGRFANQVCTG